MKNIIGKVLKDFNYPDSSVCDVSDEELQLINQLARRQLTKAEVYVFSVVLCDNDIDRDFERFTVEALFDMEKLFVGKTGIFDHNPKATNQTARIFKCDVENIANRKTANGDDYFRLKARAYMPVSEKNKSIISDIESGILKEVSVGCACSNTKCSICGDDYGACNHIKGEKYGGRVCYGELVNIVDAYEWSFVAVPAQKEAGVVKNFDYNSFMKKGGFDLDTILKGLYERKSMNLAEGDCVKLCDYIDKLKAAAKDGIYYRDSLTSEVLRLSAIVQPEISRETMENISKNLSVAELKEFKNSFEKRANEFLPLYPQLCKNKSRGADKNNSQFVMRNLKN